MILGSAIPRADLAAFAARELELRERQWPAAVTDGRMTSKEADDDILAWRALAELLEHGQTDVDRVWTEIIAAIDTARDRRRAALDDAIANDRPTIDGFADRLWRLHALAGLARDQREHSHMPMLHRIAPPQQIAA